MAILTLVVFSTLVFIFWLAMMERRFVKKQIGLQLKEIARYFEMQVWLNGESKGYALSSFTLLSALHQLQYLYALRGRYQVAHSLVHRQRGRAYKQFKKMQADWEQNGFKAVEDWSIFRQV